ncbi:MAG: hypothetical protein GF331_00935 [Chitinivibrionales bacterium]|nr:hypothetical protein [Chitinivibrionales bacterium]
MLIQLELASFGVDPSKNAPVIVLKEVGGQRSLAIPIGPFEASAIAINSLGVSVDKPQAIDLARLIMDTLGGQLQRVIVRGGDEEDSLIGRLQIARGRNTFLIDCAASHGIVLALRSSAPVFVIEEVLEGRQQSDSPSPAKALRRHIASLDTIDFGKYHLE